MRNRIFWDIEYAKMILTMSAAQGLNGESALKAKILFGWKIAGIWPRSNFEAIVFLERRRVDWFAVIIAVFLIAVTAIALSEGMDIINWATGY